MFTIPQISNQISNTLLFIIVVFILGLYFVVNYSAANTEEGFVGTEQHRCPNILIQKGTDIYLYNSRVAKVPGVNRIGNEVMELFARFYTYNI